MPRLRKLPKRLKRILLRRSEWQAPPLTTSFFHRPTSSNFEIVVAAAPPGAERHNLVRAAFVDQCGDGAPLWPEAVTALAREAIALFLEANGMSWPGIVDDVDRIVEPCSTCGKPLTIHDNWPTPLRRPWPPYARERFSFACDHGCWGCGLCGEDQPAGQNCGRCKEYAELVIPGQEATDVYAVCMACRCWIEAGSVCPFCCCPHCGHAGQRLNPCEQCGGVNPRRLQ